MLGGCGHSVIEAMGVLMGVDLSTMGMGECMCGRVGWVWSCSD